VDLPLFPLALLLLSLGLMTYSYFGYPALLWLLSRRAKDVTSHQVPREWPTVTIVVSAYNEEQVIGDRLENLLAIEYPRYTILVGSDGSSDQTCEVVRRVGDRRVQLTAFPSRRGKASVLNDLIAKATGEIVVLTDANTVFERDAVRKLVATLLAHPSACAVVGQLHVHYSAEGGNYDGLYWRYETWIKRMESGFGAVLGANGAIYAIRRRQYEPLPSSAIVDDFLIPMLIHLKYGGDILFVDSARAYESCTHDVCREFVRHVRIGAGDLQALVQTWSLLSPRHGMLALAYFSHKVLRWCSPIFLLTGLIANFWLLDSWMFRVLLGGQLSAYGLALSGSFLRPVPMIGRVTSMAWYFVVLNAALLVGYLRYMFGIARPTWSTTPRAIGQAGQSIRIAEEVKGHESLSQESRPVA
jgi:cellulose synthase/poly-beta-1,6-N-acetylglucosamine synthase-like glycosyltransferase